MTTATKPPALTIDQVRNLLATMEAEAEAASATGPTAALLADLADHRVVPRDLAKFVERVTAAFETLGVDLDDPAPPAPAPTDAPAPAPVVDPVDVTTGGGE